MSAFDIVAVDSLAAGFEMRPGAVIICTPPHLHLPLAEQTVESGAHLFVEKPLALSLAGIDNLLGAAQQKNLVFMVGYNLRFDPGLQRMKELIDAGRIGRLVALQAEFGQYLPDWRPAEDYRKGYNARSSMGGGIILDASHEVDYLRWLGGDVESVFAMAAQLGNLQIDVEDIASITLRFSSGAIGHAHLDSLQRSYSRYCKAVGTDGTVIWNPDQNVKLYSSNSREWKLYDFRTDPNDSYVQELTHFAACIKNGNRPLVSGHDGRQALAITDAVKESVESRCEVMVAQVD
jgi:predicted dehydrogenase